MRFRISDVISALNSVAASLEGNLSIAVRLTVNSKTRSYSKADAAKLTKRSEVYVGNFL
jgi:hypothetical protein